MDMRPDVEIHIDTLAIDGVSERDAARAGDAIQRELTRLIGAEPLPADMAPRAIDRLDAGRAAGAGVGAAGGHRPRGRRGGARRAGAAMTTFPELAAAAQRRARPRRSGIAVAGAGDRAAVQPGHADADAAAAGDRRQRAIGPRRCGCKGPPVETIKLDGRDRRHRSARVPGPERAGGRVRAPPRSSRRSRRCSIRRATSSSATTRSPASARSRSRRSRRRSRSSSGASCASSRCASPISASPKRRSTRRSTRSARRSASGCGC